MRLYVIRHAQAIERSPRVREEDRWLTPAGREEFRRTAGLLAKRGIVPDWIVTSPLVRAVQTADIFAEAIGFQGELMVAPELGPGFGTEGLQRVITACGMPRRLAVVGHEPDLGELVASLLGSNEPLSLRKGSVVALTFDPADTAAPALFRWLVCRGKRVTGMPKDGVL
ncbi:MAG: protein phosphatase [Desulfuromonadales bacterium]|nr:MAG: protein phosphatase [Desulfuromonadales bacterium]